MLCNVDDSAPSAIYHYFQSKEKLYTEVFKQTSSTIWDSVTPGRLRKLIKQL